MRILVLILALLTPALARAESVTPKVTPEYGSVLAGKPGTLYMLVEFDVAKPETKNTTRPALNVALVIDRSGSMEDKGKLEFAKQAAKRVVDGMTPTDRLAVVEYDDRITVLRHASPLTDPEAVKRRIDGLTSRGSTNLTGGMEEGIKEVQKAVGQGVSRVILLSDGLANQGVTHPLDIAKRATAARNKGVHVSAIGLGLDYDENLMQSIAESGGGRYYYVESPTQLARIFEEEMSLMVAVVAKDVQLVIDAEDKVRSAQVLGYVTTGDARHIGVTQSDLYAGEKRLVAIKLELAELSAGAQSVAKVHLTYSDIADGAKHTIDRDVRVTATTDTAEIERSHDLRIASEVTLIDAEQQYASSVRQYENGDAKGAAASTQLLEQQLSQKNATLKDVRIAKKLEALQLEGKARQSANADASIRKQYLKQSKASSYLVSKGGVQSFMLQMGDKGAPVEALQRALKARGVWNGDVNGSFTQDVADSVKAYQAKEGLDADGVAGPMTLQKLGLYF